MLIFSQDKKRLLEHFKKDEVLFSYHIGDLDDFFFPDCQWMACYGERAHISEALLLYSGGEIPTLLAFGLTDQIKELLTEAMDLLPEKFYCHFHDSLREALCQTFAENPLGRHIKMKLNQFNPRATKDETIVRLNSEDNERLIKLYDRHYPDHYFTPRMLETGKYYGIKKDDQLVAVAGLHVYSPDYKIAVLGNIVTDGQYRSQGLAGRVTSVLVEELVKEKLTVCLNVKADNEAAIKCYERLGFEKVHEYEEALFELIKK